MHVNWKKLNFFEGRMSKDLIAYWFVYFTYLSASSLSSVFVNIFLFKANNDLAIVVTYNMFVFILNCLGFYMAGFLAKRIKISYIAQIGIIANNIYYGLLVLLMERAADYILLLAAVNAIGGGFFFTSYSLLLYDNSTNENRDSTMALMGLCGTLAGLVMPTISGFIISGFSGDTRGYLFIFVLSLIFSLVSILCSVRVKSHKVEGKYQLHKAFALAAKTPEIRNAILGELLRGMREGVVVYLLPTVLYTVIQNEMVIGVNSFLSSMFAIASNLVIARFTNPSVRTRNMLIAIIIMTAVTPLLFFWPTVVVIMVFACVNAAFGVFTSNPAFCTMYNVMGKTMQSGEMRIEVLSLRDTATNVGRAVGCALVLILPVTTNVIIAAFFVLTVAQFLGWYLFKRAENLSGPSWKKRQSMVK